MFSCYSFLLYLSFLTWNKPLYDWIESQVVYMESLKIYLGTISHLVRFLVATERGLRLVGLTDDGLPGSRLRKTDSWLPASCNPAQVRLVCRPGVSYIHIPSPSTKVQFLLFDKSITLNFDQIYIKHNSIYGTK